MKQILKIVVAFLVWGYISNLFADNSLGKKADLVVFSYDRPMQLYALLESVERYVTGIGEIVVIWRGSDVGYKTAYSVLHKEFPIVKFVMQDHKSAEQDFKSLVLSALCSTPTGHILFAVDDIIVTDFINLSYCIEMLGRSNAYAFYLRMGKNITYNYNKSCSLKLPSFFPVASDVYSWKFVLDRYDAWNYPNTVDFALYRKATVVSDLQRISYGNPNQLEAYWHQKSPSLKHSCGLCYEHSKIVNIPLNQVQTVFTSNKHMKNFSAEMLLDLFNQGLKIDIAALFQYKNNSVHMDYEPQFIQRKEKGTV